MGDHDDHTHPFSDAFDQPTRVYPPHWHVQPPSRSPSPAAFGIILGIVAVLVLAVIGGFFLIRGQIGFGIFQAPTAETRATSPAPTATNPPMPTVAPPPTGQVAIPTPGPGFQTFAATDGEWASNYPHTALVGRSNLTIQGITVPATTFALGQGDAVNVYELPPALANAPAQELFEELITASGATNLTVLEQPTTAVIGANSWERITITAQQNGQASETVVYLAQHGTGALAISTSAPASIFPDDAQQVFGPMMQSFTFLK